MLVSCRKTERPRGPLLYLGVELWLVLCRIGGRLGSRSASLVESTLKYHSAHAGALTETRDPGREQRQAGSLTGAVAS